MGCRINNGYKIVRPTFFGALGGVVSYAYFSIKPITTTSTFTNSSGKTTTKTGEISPAIMGILGAGLGVTIHIAYPPKNTYKSLVVHPTKYNEWLTKYNSKQSNPYRITGMQGEYLLLSRNAPAPPPPPPLPPVQPEPEEFQR